MTDIQICIGFDDHMSVYSVTREQAEDLQDLADVSMISDYIVDHGTYVDAGINDTGDVFLDTTVVSEYVLEEFYDQLVSALE
jgi:hypothetical protein